MTDIIVFRKKLLKFLQGDTETWVAANEINSSRLNFWNYMNHHIQPHNCKQQQKIPGQTTPCNFLLVAHQDVPVTSIHIDFILSSRIDFNVNLSLIDLQEMILILSFWVGRHLYQFLNYVHFIKVKSTVA